MPKYWVIAPYYFNSTNPQRFEKVWQFDLDQRIISIGWGDLGDISNFSEAQLLEHILAIYKGESPEAARNYRSSLWSFCHGISKGDMVIARRGRKQIAAIGMVEGDPYYDREKNQIARNDLDTPYSYHLDMRWADFPRDKSFDEIVFGMQTVYEATENQYLTWRQAP